MQEPISQGGFDAYSPKEIAGRVEAFSIVKAQLPLAASPYRPSDRHRVGRKIETRVWPNTSTNMQIGEAQVKEFRLLEPVRMGRLRDRGVCMP